MGNHGAVGVFSERRCSSCSSFFCMTSMPASGTLMSPLYMYMHALGIARACFTIRD